MEVTIACRQITSAAWMFAITGRPSSRRWTLLARFAPEADNSPGSLPRRRVKPESYMTVAIAPRLTQDLETLQSDATVMTSMGGPQ